MVKEKTTILSLIWVRGFCWEGKARSKTSACTTLWKLIRVRHADVLRAVQTSGRTLDSPPDLPAVNRTNPWWLACFQENFVAEKQGKKSYLKRKAVSQYNYCTNIDCPTIHQVKPRLAKTLLNLKLHIRIACAQKNNLYLLEEETAECCKTHMTRGFTWLPELKPCSPINEQKQGGSVCSIPHTAARTPIKRCLPSPSLSSCQIHPFLWLF